MDEKESKTQLIKLAPNKKMTEQTQMEKAEGEGVPPCQRHSSCHINTVSFCKTSIMSINDAASERTSSYDFITPLSSLIWCRIPPNIVALSVVLSRLIESVRSVSLTDG